MKDAENIASNERHVPCQLTEKWMPRSLMKALLLLCFACSANSRSETVQSVMDIPTRPGVTERVLVVTPESPEAIAILFPGGHGGLQLDANGSARWGEGNFLVRARQLFAAKGILVAVLDAPSDRQTPPYLAGFRQKKEHAEDVRAVIAALRAQVKKPVWLVGTSRGTQSVAYVATQLSDSDGAHGLVLTSTILSDDKGRPVPAIPLSKITMPVLVVHHEGDTCQQSSYKDRPKLADALHDNPKAQILTVKGGTNQGDPCEARAYHGFNGIEQDVVRKITDWMLNNQ
jgi:dienelactone hydrolase